MELIEEGNVTRYRFGEATRPSVAVVEAIAAATGRDVYDVPPLYEVVDPDALDDLFSSKHDGTARTAGQVAFNLADCDVYVAGHGEVLVHPQDASAADSSPSSASGSV